MRARMLFHGLVGGLILFSVVGCGEPCDELSERICKRAGEESAECVQARAVEDSAANQSACRRVLKMGETLSKNR